MQTKADQIRAVWLTGDQIDALRIAGRFFDRSNETMIFKCSIDANNHPSFYRQLGKEPQELITAALDLLAKRTVVNACAEKRSCRAMTRATWGMRPD